MNHPAGYRFFHIVAMIFVTTLILANTLAVKIVSLFGFTLPAGIIVFPIAYIFGDVLTEVYGFRKARSVIWWGFFCLAMMAFFFWAGTLLPPAPFWKDQEAFARLFGFVPRIALASLIAYLVGEFINSAVLSKLKVRTEGRHFWLRAVLSTVIGQGADSLIFNFSAFLGVFPLRDLLFIAFSGWILKTAYEVVALPLTYACARFLKRAEGVDTYDREISYSPFAKH
jgi:uncharacterized integral membrane protein (TIGR00697 family)